MHEKFLGYPLGLSSLSDEMDTSILTTYYPVFCLLMANNCLYLLASTALDFYTFEFSHTSTVYLYSAVQKSQGVF